MKRAPAVFLAVLALVAAPAVALAHPLGNFTINHYAGIVVGPSEIRLDVVLDRAEIPAFQERLRIDADEDGEVSDAEVLAVREADCRMLATSLELTVDGRATELELTAVGLSFPPGAGGLSTMRLVCGFVAPIEGGIAGGRTITFADRSFPDRLGWREIVVAGDRVTVVGADLLGTSPSQRLTAYPADRLEAPLAIGEVTFRTIDGGAPLAPVVAPDATPLDGATESGMATDGGHAAPVTSVAAGIAVDVPSAFQADDLSPGVLLAALATAVALGAGHALTPGHGKTLMAAYLVGTRGTPLHAAGLGLSVTVSHTLGILVLAALIVGAGAALPADVVVRGLPAVAALTIVAIGTWMLVGEVRRRRTHPAALPSERDHAHDHAHGHDHGRAAAHGHGHPERLPATTITWRSLFALGLAGGLVPSTSALVILLGTIAAGRPAFGVALVVAFGLGMATVMSGIGLALVLARERLERVSTGGRVDRLSSWTPLLAASLVLALGLWLTGQALMGSFAG